MATFLICLVLAFILGFAAHRASICMVRAVAEIQHSRTGYMAASIGKTILWIVLVTLPVFWLAESSGPYLGGWQLTAWAVAGGFLFGAGAGINGACAYSTMTRLMDGEGRMAATVIGFTIGIVVFTMLIDAGRIAAPIPAQPDVDRLVDWAAFIVVGLGVLAAYEMLRLWRSRPKDASVASLILARQYRLSTAALLIGLAGATIFLLFGSAGYTSTFEVVIQGLFGKTAPATGRWLLLLAVLGGMLTSSLERRSFSLDVRPRPDWLRHIGGGVLMGMGTALAPGGNDVLVLYAIPVLSPHALPAFAAMAIGVVAGLLIMRRAFGVEMRVSCRNDTYVSG
ncbi:YeeE/YedE thiosulfate transporter family protein [Bauldia litoralis]|uniref:Sulphur transport n=1 Tax=Bauldia litoralis TaxID=665467 RepID=A0A1G6B1B0_9HYPH|nr:YeeE/YedE thiosulfate transporter family protein [Bauldia litoralis]SDB14467.1 Sulphur transport [Bauldia litoralis]